MVKKISVIGGAGFVGTSLCQSLAGRQIPFNIADLRASNRIPQKSKIADIRDVDSLRKVVSGGIVINLAAVYPDYVQDKSEYFDTNVSGAINVATVCSENNIIKMVFPSSVAFY